MRRALKVLRSHALLALTLTLTLVGCGLGAAEQGRMSAAYEVAESEHAAILTQLDEEQARLGDLTDEAQTLLDATGEDAVADVTVLETLRSDREGCDALLGYEPEGVSGGHWVLRWHSLEDVNSDAEDTLAQIATLNETLAGDIEAVNDSVHQKQVSDARDALSSLIGTARDTLSGSEGRVTDDGTRDELSAAIDAAQALVDEGSDDLDALKQRTDDLQAACDAVDSSVSAWQQAQAARAARAASSSGGGSSSSGGGGAAADTWYVNYYNAYGTAEAAADGSVTQWADGYFVAHVWSSNGQRILSRPTYVVVNGRTYRYVSSMEVSRDTTWQAVEPYVHAGGGIGFQTCVNGGGYFISHYEPV